MAKREHCSSQLISQIETLHQRIADLEKDNQAYRDREQDGAKLAHFLKERVKELNCLYGIAEQIERSGNSIEMLLQGIVELFPGSWQYPEITVARILFEGKEYVTSNFRNTCWKQAANIKVGGKEVGVVEVYYIEEKPEIVALSK